MISERRFQADGIAFFIGSQKKLAFQRGLELLEHAGPLHQKDLHGLRQSLGVSSRFLKVPGLLLAAL